MRHDSSFVDLRLNQQQGDAANESFWPSFTDIMTVIVMIFLIAMVVLLMRNMELIDQLRTTMQAERDSAELARTTTEEKATLALRLINTEKELSSLRVQMMHMEEVSNRQTNTIQTQQQKISSLSTDRSRLISETSLLSKERNQLLIDVQNNSRQLTRLKSELNNRQNELNNRQEELNMTLTQLAQAQESLQKTRETLNERSQDLEASRLALEQSGNILTSLEDNYSQLKVKYDKLIRPARTSQGKHIVEVRYTGRNNQLSIEIKDADDDTFYSVSREQLNQKLAQLKDEQKKQLYIKVIIPENSGLSYSEAWKFTSELHKNYDYYFQEEKENTKQ